MSTLRSFLLFVIVVASTITTPSSAQLSTNFYDYVCPEALPAIREVVKKAILEEPRMGASLLRLHFHDCFVNGCDGSVLLDDTSTFTGEKTALPNSGSLRGFEVIDKIKKAVDEKCNGSVVSCADILAVAARDSVNLLAGPSYDVALGRRDARTASLNDANRNVPPPFFNFSQLLSNFQSQGLDLKDLVVLSGAHTIGFARCGTFKDRIYNDTNIDAEFAAALQQNCPRNDGDNNLEPLDATPAEFDSVYFSSLLKFKGLLHSDQELFKGDGSESDNLVQRFKECPSEFWAEFSASMIRMGNIRPLTGENGEVRLDCRKLN